MSIKIDENGLTIINGKYGPIERPQTFWTKRTCGCCMVKMVFNSEQSIRLAFEKAGLGMCQDIEDDSGQKWEGIDTFYGYSRVKEKQAAKGPSYLNEYLF